MGDKWFIFKLLIWSMTVQHEETYIEHIFVFADIDNYLPLQLFTMLDENHNQIEIISYWNVQNSEFIVV